MMPAAYANEPVLNFHRFGCFGEKSNTAHHRHMGRKPPAIPVGIDLAISNLSLGGGAILAGCRRRGGARNRADRESKALTLAQVANLMAAARQAEAIGLPLTRMLSIHWEAAGVPLAGMVKATGRFTDLLSKALARHGHRTAWLWVHEGGDGKGGHCHLLAHVPADLVAVVSRLQRGWLHRITGQPYRASVILSKPIGGRLGLEVTNPDLYRVNLEKALAYVLKGACPKAARRFGLKRIENGGLVIGKRCGTSHNIGAKARKVRHGEEDNAQAR